jgi:hypothetical protein
MVDYQPGNSDEFPFGKNLHAMPFDVIWKLAIASNKQRA